MDAERVSALAASRNALAVLTTPAFSSVVPIARPVQTYAIRLTLASHPGSHYATALVNRYVRYGASPRAAISLMHVAKAHAAMDGRDYLLPDDVKAVAGPVMRHRIVLKPEADLDGLTADQVLQDVIGAVEVPK